MVYLREEEIMKRFIKNIMNNLFKLVVNLSPCYNIGKGTYGLLSAHLDKFVSIGDNCMISHTAIGKYSYLGNHVHMPCTKIGAFSSIASGVTLGAGNHPTHFVSMHPVTFKKNFIFPSKYVEKEPGYEEFVYTDNSKKFYCEIGNDVWISTNALLLCGKNALHIGDGAVIRGGSVVTNDIPPYAIVQGCPAKIIGFRFSKEIIQKLLKLEWWNQSDAWLKKYNQYFSDPEYLFLILEQEQINVDGESNELS